MKVSMSRWIRSACLPAFGLLTLGTVVDGCGDKSSNPDAVTVDELKYPGNLVISDRSDKADGIVTLEWSGANNEDDFDGYNVYGMKGTATCGTATGTLPVTCHQAIELLDDKGDASEAAKAILAKFNYDPATKLSLAGPLNLADTPDTAKDKPEFSALPIHTGAADARLLPTCKAHGGTCTMTTAADKEVTAKSNPGYAVNGRVSFDVPDTLKVGESYCFFIMASMNNGEKVSQTSSNVECIVPKYKLAMDLKLPAANANNELFDLRAILAACTKADKCDATAAAANVTETGKDSARGGVAASSFDHTASDAGPLYIERSSGSATSTPTLGLVAGKGAAINDIGYYSGLDDATLPKAAPVLVMDDTPIGGTGSNAEAPIFNAGGYSIPGQTVLLQAKHVYVIAVGAAGATGVGPYNYHWLYVGDAPTGATVAVKMRLSKTAL